MFQDSEKEDSEYTRVIRKDTRRREVIQLALAKARSAALKAVKQWFADFDEMWETFPNLPEPGKLMELLHDPSWPTNCPYKRGDRVWARYSSSERWLVGTVLSANEDFCQLNVQIDDVGSDRKFLRNLPYNYIDAIIC